MIGPGTEASSGAAGGGQAPVVEPGAEAGGMAPCVGSAVGQAGRGTCGPVWPVTSAHGSPAGPMAGHGADDQLTIPNPL